MSRKVKILGWLSTVLVLLVLVVVVAAKLLVTPEGVRQTLLPLAEEKLGRPVDIGEISIELFSGITLEKISVASGKNGLALFQAEKALLRYRFWPLLTGRVMIDQISLQKPVLRLHRDVDGGWDLLEMFSPDAGQDVTPTMPDERSAEKSVQTEKPEHAGGFDLLVTNVLLTAGEVEITDRKLNPSAPYRFQLKNIDLQINDFSLEQPFSIKTSVHVGQALLGLAGRFDPAGQKHDLQLQIENFDLAPLSPYLKGLLPGIFSRARVTSDIRFTGNPERFDLTGKLAFNQIYLVLDALEKSPIRNASLTFEPDLTVDRGTGLVSLRSSRVAVDGVGLKLTGAIEKIEDLPVLDVQVSWQDIDLRELLAAVPQGLLPRLDQVDPAGRLSGHVGLRGSLSQPEKLVQAGKLSLVDVQMNLGNARPALTGDLNLVGMGLASEKLRLRLGDDQADLNLTVKDVLARPVEIRNQIQSPRIDIDRLLQAVGTEEPASEQRERTEKLSASPRPDTLVPNEGARDTATEPGPLDLPLTVDGSVEVQELLFKGLKFGDFKMGYRVADNLLDVRRMTATVAGGHFSKTAKVNLAQRGFSYEAEVKVEAVDSGDILNAMLPDMQGSLSGKLTLDAMLKGRGTTAASLQKNLSGTGHLSLLDGVANGTKISRGMVNLLGMQQLEQITIQKAEGNFSVGKGVVNVSGIVAGRELQMVPKGKVHLAGKLDLGLLTRLAPKAAAKLGSSKVFSRLLKDDDGWTVLPLKVKGDIENPKVALDEKQLGRQAEKKVKKELEQKLLEKFAPEPKEGEVEDPSRKIIKDTLRGLFGK